MSQSELKLSPRAEDGGHIDADAVSIKRRLGVLARAFLLTVGVASVTGLSTITGSMLGYEPRVAVMFALPSGTAVGFLLAVLMIMIPEARAARDRRLMISRIEAVARSDRDATLDTLLAIDPEHELAELTGAIHEAMRSAHSQRLEAARVRREVNAFVEKETKRKYAHLETLSVTDELTGLSNRRGFEQGLEELVAKARRAGEELALLAIDLDHFKRLNDTCGHDKGDEALSVAGDLLQAHVRGDDLAGRVGGDELFVALYGVDDLRASRIAERLIKMFSTHPAGSAPDCPWPSMSVGISLLKADRAEGADELRRFADQALYASKRSGRRRHTRFKDVA